MLVYAGFFSRELSHWLGLFSYTTVLLSPDLLTELLCPLLFSHSCLCSASTVSLQLERNINKGRGIYIRIGRATERSKTTIRIQLNPRGTGGNESGERQRSQLLRRKGSKELFHSGRGLNVKNLVRCPFFIVHYGRWSKSGHWAAVAYWQWNTVVIVLPCQGSALRHEGLHIRELDPSHERWPRRSASKLYE